MIPRFFSISAKSCSSCLKVKPRNSITEYGPGTSDPLQRCNGVVSVCVCNENNGEASGQVCAACSEAAALVGLQEQQQQQQRADDTDSFTPRIRSDKKSVTMLLGEIKRSTFIHFLINERNRK